MPQPRSPFQPVRPSSAPAASAQSVHEFSEFARQSDRLDAVEAELARRLEPFGVRHFMHGEAVTKDGRPSAAFRAGRSHADWRRHYVEKNFAGDDQLMLSGLASPEPWTWRRFSAETAISKAQRRIFDEAQAFGLSDGFFLPLHQLDGAVDCVSFFAEAALPEHADVQGALHLLALYYGFAARRLKRPPALAPLRMITLTPRQKECLQWARAGKSDWEISQIIGISQHTVSEHVELARRRLGVRTRSQAVIEAIALGLIHI